MAKAAQQVISAESADPQIWLADVLRVRFEEVLRQIDAALDQGQIDGVHDMRVASRRLRSALRDFGEVFDAFSMKSINRRMRDLADALGTVRDQDVAITELEKLGSNVESDQIRSGIDVFVQKHREIRKREYKKLSKKLSGTEIFDLRLRFNRAVDAAPGQRQLFEPTSVADAGRKVISARLDEFTRRADCIYEPFNSKAHHKLRITGKRLRYATELFAPSWAETLVPFAKQIAEMQGHLGDLHDCDLWIGDLEKQLTGKDKDTVTPQFQAAAWLMSEFVKKRTKEYRAALELWIDWQCNKFVDRFTSAIS